MMIKNELVTVIIPVYNVEKYLDRCMQSILNQTYYNLEIIIVDDESDDNSNELCKKYLVDKRVILKHGKKEGLSGARNEGLKIARGEYVLFVDSDDYIDLDMIENLYRTMVNSEADTVIAGFSRRIGEKVEVRNNKFAGMKFENREDIINNVLKKMIAPIGDDFIEMSVWKTLFSMKIIIENKIFFPDKKYLSEDIIFDFAYYPLAKKVVMSENTGYHYCLNDESLSQMYQENKVERIKFQTNEMRKLTTKMNFDEEAFIRVDNFYIGNLIHHMKIMAASVDKIGSKKCIESYKKICNDEGVLATKWNLLEKCFTGRDKIPFFLLKKKSAGLLYLYFLLLIYVREKVRK